MLSLYSISLALFIWFDGCRAVPLLARGNPSTSNTNSQDTTFEMKASQGLRVAQTKFPIAAFTCISATAPRSFSTQGEAYDNLHLWMFTPRGQMVSIDTDESLPGRWTRPILHPEMQSDLRGFQLSSRTPTLEDALLAVLRAGYRGPFKDVKIILPQRNPEDKLAFLFETIHDHSRFIRYDSNTGEVRPLSSMQSGLNITIF